MSDRQHNSTLPNRTTRMPRGTKRIGRNRQRQAENFERANGGVERVLFVKTLPCIVPGCTRRDIQNMHIKGGGMSRKANAQFIVPACSPHHDFAHTEGIETFAATFGIDLEAAAAATEQAWREVA